MRGELASDLHIVASNLEAGRWPAEAISVLRTLAAAVRAEQAGFARLATASDLAAFKSQHARLKPVMTRTDSALRAARLALHLPAS